MRFSAPELARRPFENLRPVRRASVLMWILGGLVLAFNMWLYSTHFAALSDHHDRLQALSEKLAAAEEAVVDLDADLGQLNLDWQNRQVILLNSLIDQRTFSWSDLIDHLGEVLPRKVRLSRLTPRITGDRDSRSRRIAADPVDRRVTLGFSGSADDDQALLEFIDALFSHPSFENPVLSGESRGEAGDISSFTMTVTYLPDRTEEAESGEAPGDVQAAEAAEPVGESKGADESDPVDAARESGP